MHGSGWRAALAASALILLSGCADGRPDGASPQFRAAPPAPPAGVPRLAASGSIGGSPGLVGLSRAEVSRLLGPPTLLRSEPPAEVWQYAGAACVLYVFIYQDPGGGRVAYYEAALRSGARLPAGDCYSALLSGRRLGES